MPSLPPRWCACPLSGCPSRGHHRPRDSRLADRHQSASVPRSRRGRRRCRRRKAGRADGPRRHNRLLPVAVCCGRRHDQVQRPEHADHGHGKPSNPASMPRKSPVPNARRNESLANRPNGTLRSCCGSPAHRSRILARVTATADRWCGGGSGTAAPPARCSFPRAMPCPGIPAAPWTGAAEPQPQLCDAHRADKDSPNVASGLLHSCIRFPRAS